MNNKDRAALLTLVLSMPLLLSYLIAPTLLQPALLFLKTWGGDYSDYGRHVAVDSFGNVYVSGLTSSFGVDHPSASYPFLIKYDSMGILLGQWFWSEPNSDFSGAEGVAVDSGLNIYLTGWTAPPLLSPLTIPTAFLLKLNSTGGLLWQKAWDAAGARPVGSAVAVDALGNIYVAGQIEGYSGVTTVSLLKFDSAGSLLWKKNWGETGHDLARSVATDSHGDVYVAGSTGDVGKEDILLLKFDSSGNLTSEGAWGVSKDVTAFHVVVDNYDFIYVTGCTMNAGASGGDGVLLRFEGSGYPNPKWQRQWTSGGNDCSYGDSVDRYGNVYVAGDTTSASGVYNAYLMKFSSVGDLEWQNALFQGNSKYAGSLSWTQPVSGNYNNSVRDLATDSSGNLFVTGSLAESPHFTLGMGNYEISTPSLLYRGLTSKASSPSWDLSNASGVVSSPLGSESYSRSNDVFLLKFGESSSIYIDTTLVLAILTATPIIRLRRRIFG